MGHLIGIDAGSQSIKGVLVDPAGKVVATAAAPLTMAHPRSGWAEQDPHTWESAVEAVVRDLTRQSADAEVMALGLACQVDGVVACDVYGRALRPAIIWLDRRATAQTAQLVGAIGTDCLLEVTGLNADSSHSAPKMMWLRDCEPDIWAATTTLAPVSSYLLHWLTGVHAQDAANASSTLLYDLASETFHAALCEAAGIDPALLPPVRPSTDVVGTLTARAARQLGLPESCQVVVGTGDEHAASLAAGAIGPGMVVDVTGTAEPVTAASTDPLRDPTGLVETHGHAVPGTWLMENPGFVSGGSTLWLAKSVLGRPQADVFDLAAEAPAGADGVIFLPTMCGSTTPRWNDAMRGAFTGLSMNHGQSHLARAVLEGCAFALRDVVERLTELGLAGDEVRVVGGGARSPLWLQVKADVLGCPVLAVTSRETTALGAAMLAGVGVGVWPTFAAAVAAAVEVAPEPVLPDTAHRSVYDDAYGRYLSLFDGVERAT